MPVLEKPGKATIQASGEQRVNFMNTNLSLDGDLNEHRIVSSCVSLKVDQEARRVFTSFYFGQTSSSGDPRFTVCGNFTSQDTHFVIVNRYSAQGNFMHSDFDINDTTFEAKLITAAQTIFDLIVQGDLPIFDARIEAKPPGYDNYLIAAGIIHGLNERIQAVERLEQLGSLILLRKTLGKISASIAVGSEAESLSDDLAVIERLARSIRGVANSSET